MVHTLFHGLASQPFILLFMVVAIGYMVGRVNIKGVGLGATASTLLIGLALSLVSAKLLDTKLEVPEFASTVFFNLFMFSVGMKVGPQFLSGLRRDAGKFIFLGLFIPVLAFALIFVVRALFHPGPGFTAGIFAGSNTATPGLGAAQSAYASGTARLPAGASVGDAMANMSTAFAFTYCISMILFIVAMKIPDILGANTTQAAKKFEASLKGAGDLPLPGAADEFFSTTLPTTLPVGLRTYEVEKSEATGAVLGAVRREHPMLSVERVVRSGKVIDPKDDVVLQAHDEVTLYGQIERLVVAGPHIGHEIYDRVARDVGAQTVDVVVQSDVAGRKLIDLASDVGHGLYLNAMFRAGDPIPFGPETVVHKGDVLRVTGSNYRLKILEKEAGSIVRPSIGTDIVTLALGLTLGSLIGAMTIPVAGIKLSLGSAVGLLLVGIGLSTLRTRYPGFGGPYPEPARQFVEDLGLNVFIAILGINAGPGVIKAVSQGAMTPIVLGCLVVGFVPPIIAWFVGTRFLKMNLALLMGAVAGGRCNSAGMQVAQEVSHSTVPAISYPVTFAISNVILTLMSYLMAILG